MKLKFILPIIALVALFAGILSYQAMSQDSTGTKILYYTCPMHPSVKTNAPGNCPYCGMTLEAVYADDNATNDATTHSRAGTVKDSPKPYPLKTCVVSGEKLGVMGKPIEFVYTNNGANQEIKFCCPGCRVKFLAHPDQYMKMIEKAEAKK